MKRLLTLTNVLAVILAASTSFAAQESTWGNVKDQLTNAPAAKRSTKSATSTATTADATTLDSYFSLLDSYFSLANGRSVTKTIGAKGGLIQLQVNVGGKARDDLAVGLAVPYGALSEDISITMTVYGNTLSDLVVDFDPGGLAFAKHAVMDLQLGSDLVDIALDDLHLLHIHDDGTAEDAGILATVEWGKNTTHIVVSVPGFSRYGLSGGF